MSLTFDKALQEMTAGKSLISEESGTVYTIDSQGMKTGNEVVDTAYVSAIEVNGMWHVINVDKRKQFRRPRISAEEKDILIREAINYVRKKAEK